MPTKTTTLQTIQVPLVLNQEIMTKLEESLETILAAGTGTLILDCAPLTNVSSLHIGLIWKFHSRCESCGISVILNSVSQALSRILRVLEFDRLLEINETSGALENSSHLPQSEKEAKRGFVARCGTDDDSVAAVNDSFREYIRNLQLESHEAIDLETVFYEVITNIKDHADVDPGGYITVSAQFVKQQVVLNFADPGKPFDPTKWRCSFNVTESLKNGQKSGFGLTMISRMTDKIKYRRSKDGVNLLSLTKLLAKEITHD